MCSSAALDLESFWQFLVITSCHIHFTA